MVRTVAAVTLLMGVGACATPRLPMQYEMPMVSVERPADVSDRWGEYTLEATDSSGVVYEDDLIGIGIAPARGMFQAVIENRSDHTIQLVWDQAVYVGPNGVSGRLSNGETRVMDLERSQPPTVIPRGARSVLGMVPNDNFESGTYGNYFHDFVPLEEGAEQLEGREVRVVLPFSVQDVVNEYTFVFKIEDVGFPWTDPECTVARYEARRCHQ